MKKIIVMALMLLAGIAAKAQAHFEYSYDNNGNRVQRVYLLSKTNPDTTNNTRTTDSTAIAATNQTTQPPQQTPVTTILGEQKVTVFPNPTSGQLQIDITNFIEGSKGYILATDMQGRVFYKIENVNSTNKLDFSSLAKGNYTVKIVLNNTSKEWIIVKE
jgi:hypothetical protein